MSEIDRMYNESRSTKLGVGWLTFASSLLVDHRHLQDPRRDLGVQVRRRNLRETLQTIIFDSDLAAWGWIWLLLGILMIVAGFAVVKGDGVGALVRGRRARRRRHQQLLLDRLSAVLDAGARRHLRRRRSTACWSTAAAGTDFRPPATIMTATITPTASDDSSVDWYSLPADEVCRRLGVDPAVGLTDAEVVERRARYGSNRLAEAPPEPAWKAFLRQYKDLMQLVLVGAAVVSIVAIQDIATALGRVRSDRAQRRDGHASGGQGRRERRLAAQDADHDRARAPRRRACRDPRRGARARRHRRFRGRRQGARRRARARGGDARDRGGRADRREHAGLEGGRLGRGHRMSRSATGSTWRT